MKCKFNWNEIQAYYDLGNSIVKVCKEFNVSEAAVIKAAKTGRLKTRTVSDAAKLGHKNRLSHSEETKAKLSKIASDRGFGGKNYRKTFKYKDVTLESSYELRLAENLDKNKINWQRPKRFYWFDSTGKKRHYTPDFYLVDYDVYLDPKNDYLIIQDKEKIETCSLQNNIKVYVLSKHQLNWEDVKKVLKL
jgi:transposase